MKNKISIYLVISSLIVMLFTIYGCKKQDDFLNVKKNNYDVVPTTLDDFQAILNNDRIMNNSYPEIGLMGSDNYYLNANTYQSLAAPYNTSYSWATDIWNGGPAFDWNSAYQRVAYANVVLDGIKSITISSSNKSQFDVIKGSALFYRAFDFYNVASIFCKPYIKVSAGSDLGIPLRLTSDINIKSTRSTVEQTYLQIVNDLKLAIPLLPGNRTVTTQPSKIAAIALLAKVYLSMNDYTNSELYADMALSLNSKLLDFNDSTQVHYLNNLPLGNNPNDNPEVIFFAAGIGYYPVYALGPGIVDSNLYSSYNINDLRKTLLFRISDGLPQFRGTYTPNGYNFAGIATNEIYFISAESAIRNGNNSQALKDLNAVLSKRYKSGTFSQITIANSDSLLTMILRERRKELPFTGNVRWEDLRRLNQDPRFETTLKRNISGTVFQLPPNDPRYVYPLPITEIQLSGLQQNPR